MVLKEKILLEFHVYYVNADIYFVRNTESYLYIDIDILDFGSPWFCHTVEKRKKGKILKYISLFFMYGNCSSINRRVVYLWLWESECFWCMTLFTLPWSELSAIQNILSVCVCVRESPSKQYCSMLNIWWDHNLYSLCHAWKYSSNLVSVISRMTIKIPYRSFTYQFLQIIQKVTYIYNTGYNVVLLVLISCIHKNIILV